MTKSAKALLMCASLCVGRVHTYSAPTAYTAVSGTQHPASCRPSSAHRSTATSSDDVASMQASAIKQELDQLGVRYDDCFEKLELAARLRQARSANPSASTQESAASQNTQPPPQQAWSQPHSSTYSSTSNPSKSAEKSGIAAMRISEIKLELDNRGVGYSDLLEKSEFVARLKSARSSNSQKTAAPAGASTVPPQPRSQSQSKTSSDEPEYRELKTQRMNQDAPAAESGATTEAPSSAGGFDFGSLLNSLGSLGGMVGGAGGSGNLASSFGGISQLISKVSGNPKAMAAIQKAAGNPKLMEAVKDVMKSPGNIRKYTQDPEIMSVLKEIKEIF